MSAHLGAALFAGAVDTQCQSRGGWERGFSRFWGLPVPAALWGAFGSWLLSCAVGRLGTLPSNLSREPRMPRSAAGAPRRGGDGAVGEGTVQLRAAQLFAT